MAGGIARQWNVHSGGLLLGDLSGGFRVDRGVFEADHLRDPVQSDSGMVNESEFAAGVLSSRGVCNLEYAGFR